jgi:hypothetical protein
MPQPETRAWWSDVQHVRDSIERKREKEARRGLRLDARSAARAVADRDERTVIEDADRAVDEVSLDDALLGDDLAWVTRPRRRFERSDPESRGRFARPARDHGEPRRDDAARWRDDSEPRQEERGGVAGASPPSADRVRAPEAAPHAADRVRAAEAAPHALEAPSRRRTVEITGRTVGAPSLPRLVEIDRRRPARRPVERVGPRPDRLALWAVILGFFLILVAVTSTSHAATRAPGARAVDGHTAHSQVVRAYTATLRATPPAR